MCGIAGAIEFDPGRTPSLEGLRAMARVLVHRGPDEEGIYHSGPVGLVHRRLSIIDLASGQQPMSTADGDVWIVFNGEVYNYRELKLDLEHRGYTFRTNSDTEVLLTLYRAWGVDAFAKVNGMFACAIWDRRTDRLVLARDRFGKKPLLYHLGGNRVLFGSELKALLAYGDIDVTINPRALHEYFTHSYFVGEDTIVDGIRRVPPAHYVTIDRGRPTFRRYWELQFEPQTSVSNETDVVERLEVLLRGAVQRRLMSEVPLGAFLSGGLDSSTVVGLMAQLSDRPVRTFTVGFEEADYSELEDARAVARHFGTDHHEMLVKPAALEILPDLVWYLDEPFGDSSAVPTYYVCRAARQHVTVALSGDGGDEVFAGYTRYLSAGRGVPGPTTGAICRLVAQALPFTWPGWNSVYAKGWQTPDGPLRGVGIYPYIQRRLYTRDFEEQIRDAEPFAFTDRVLSHSTHLDPVSRFQHVDTLQYLPGDILTKVDRMSMANSLEVRSPLLDVELVEYVATLPVALKLKDGVGKWILRRFGSHLLPPSVLAKRKQGFAIPKGRWFREDLRAHAEGMLLDRKTLARGYVREDTLRRMLRHHATGRRDYSTWIWCLLVLETWFRAFLDVPRYRQAA